MAFFKTANCLILAALWARSAQFPAPFPVRHEHLRKGCEGVMTVDEEGVRFTGARTGTGTKTHAWVWKYEDIQELTLGSGSIHILTYEDRRLGLGADREYNFTGKPPVESLYGLLRDRMDQRFIAAVVPQGGLPDTAPGWRVPVKHLGRMTLKLRTTGSEGTLAFDSGKITYFTATRGDSRTWRYSDIDSISSSGPFQLTITTFEQARSHYGDRRGFNFQLKQSITEARYNELWLQIERKNGRIQ
jgi:hypothetical protein